jgi:Delta-aminolevulinic acid dehydratase
MSLSNFPSFRARRQRRDDWSRQLVSENSLSVNDLIYPVFVTEGTGRREKVSSMPGVERLSLDLLLPLAEEASRLAIPVLAVFPVIEADRKDLKGSESFNANGLVPRTVSALKKNFPTLGS